MTGREKNPGHDVGSGGGCRDFAYALGSNAKTAMKKKVSSCRVAAMRYVRKLFMRAKICRDISKPRMMVLSPSSVRTISAAALAASVAPKILFSITKSGPTVNV